MEPLGDYDGVEPRGTTDEKGNFRLKGVPPGSYMIMVFQQGDRDGIFEAHGRQKLEVAGENIESLTIVVGRGASVRGRVVVDGPGTLTLSRVGVGLHPVDEEDLTVQDRMKKDGTFEIKEVQDSNYAVYVWGLEENWYVKSARFGADDVLSEGL